MCHYKTLLLISTVFLLLACNNNEEVEPAPVVDNLSGTRTFVGWHVKESSYMDKDGTIVQTVDSTWVDSLQVTFEKLNHSSVWSSFAPQVSDSIFGFTDNCLQQIHDSGWQHYEHSIYNGIVTIHYHPANNTIILNGGYSGKGPYGDNTLEHYWEK